MIGINELWLICGMRVGTQDSVVILVNRLNSGFCIKEIIRDNKFTYGYNQYGSFTIQYDGSVTNVYSCAIRLVKNR